MTKPTVFLKSITPKPTVSRADDLWLLGKHKLLCADATREGHTTVSWVAKRANMIFTDPPYNVQIEGNVSGLGKIKHREFVMGLG